MMFLWMLGLFVAIFLFFYVEEKSKRRVAAVLVIGQGVKEGSKGCIRPVHVVSGGEVEGLSPM